MSKIIEVIYENGVFKPLGKVDLPENVKLKIKIEESGVITKEFLHELRRKLEELPKSELDLEKLDEIYYEGKLLH
ncbi:MAG: antitoxin family protein [Archaeoglobus sp.]|uniref:antitoxin family protein n=1 Tax=Archaeoglobus sp. TaxID=1872626 RepID=UPI001DCABE46|nr:antitoxin family protein [Archaeoglobus sp.]MBO8180841.1 antitoxin family protein [Archaeoglobus sp.]